MADLPVQWERSNPLQELAMASVLARIGRTSVRHRRVVLAAWLAILVAVVACAGAFKGPTSNGFSIPGTESQKATDLLTTRFPSLDAAGAKGMVVFAAPKGSTLDTPAAKAAVQATLAKLKTAPQVSSVTDPYQLAAVSKAMGMNAAFGVSHDGTVAYSQVSYPVQPMEVTPAALNGLEEAATPARHAGIDVNFGGAVHPGMQTKPGGSSETIGLLVAIVVLLISFGSLIAAGLPILTALIGVGTGIAGITALSGVIQLSSTAPTLATMIGLAVGIDYALFIVSRHRQNLARGMTPEAAASHAVATAGSAVVFAALTVIVALCGLTVVNIPFLTVMALAAAGTVLVACLIALTLLPALLGFAGNTIDRIRVPGIRLHQAGDAQNGIGARWARGVVRRPVTVVVAVIVALGIVAVPTLSLDRGRPSDATAPASSTQRKAYDQLSAGFGPGFNGPLMVVVDAKGAKNPKLAATTAGAAVAKVPGVVTVTPPIFNPAGDTAILNAYPSTGPADAATTALVHKIRAAADAVHADTGVELAVTGATAMNIDVSAKLGQALPEFAAVVAVLALLILMLAFRSVLVPIKATLGFLLTIVTTFGAVVAVFQWGWAASLFGVHSTGPIVSFLPILLMAVLFGLAMDYEVFLVSRMREEVSHGTEPEAAIIAGFTGGARVVTAAALIMTSVFSAFMLGDDAIIKSMGFALAFGVLVDAFVVRMTLVPAVMALFGESAWWLPRWLDRILPHVDIEGGGFAGDDPDGDDDGPSVSEMPRTSPPSDRLSPQGAR
ncbi:MAG: MMPL family transporter [Actinobacteria bacterium]|nr:MMPL family transporter [Actinomycetota bacterium]